MAVNIELIQLSIATSEALKAKDSRHVQYMPCQVNHDGEAAVDKYFTTYVHQETVKGEGDERKGLVGSLRGYPLVGAKTQVPEGYTGMVLRETRPGLSMDEDNRTMKAVCQFDSFTFWNWDRHPSRSDRYQQAMDWTTIADVIHGDDSPLKGTS
ncbi:hypothetical protein Pmani_002155 [Petrolisthes manimaculis]|uniref:Uncharacterized protein n=1 Tax=Petrolisthes manimaculis TaxID=1843537 RepID=A0AAE1QIY8_9EUCA|nr:hypothetical protein Pmani_002155 [Petrolisthes manimaculis]